MSWQPIETAPQDGRDLWLFVPSEEPSQIVGFWTLDAIVGGHWRYRDAILAELITGIEPTHWQPLPPPPTSPPSSR